MASGAGDDAASLAKAGGANDAATSSPVKKNEPVPCAFPWKDLPPADACMPVLGVADDELWPELGTAAAKGKGKGKAPSSSSSTALDAPITMAPPIDQGSISTQSAAGASTRRHGHRAAGSAAAVVPSSPMHVPNSSRERRAAAAPEQPPTHAPIHHRSNNNAGARGQQQQNGRFVPHPHGRSGGEGYNRGGGSRRPPPVVGGGANNGRGDINGNANAAYRNRGGGGGGGWQRQEHRGGFNGPPRGRGHQDDHRGPEHRPVGPPMGYPYTGDHHGPGGHRQLGPPPMGYDLDAPHHMMHPAPPFMGMVPPLMPYPYYYCMPYGYPEFFPGYFAPPLQGPPFMHNAALPQMHIMEPNLNQQAGPWQAEPQQQQPVQGQQPPPNQENQQTLEQLRQAIREQIEYYFSTENLDGDIYLRSQMDEQGWVPLMLIAGFNKVCSKTTNMELILDSILPSTEVDVVDGKIRKRVGWERYTSVKNSSEATTSQ